MLLIFFHWEPSARCQSFSSLWLHLSKCQLIILASQGFENKHFKWDITSRYHMEFLSSSPHWKNCLLPQHHHLIATHLHNHIALVAARLAHRATIIVFILFSV